MIRNFFGVAGLCFQDPGAPGGARTAGVTCEFCECGLAGDGAVLKTSARARQLARIDEKIEKLEQDKATALARVTELETQLAAALAKLAAIPPIPAPEPRRGGLHFD